MTHSEKYLNFIESSLKKLERSRLIIKNQGPSSIKKSIFNKYKILYHTLLKYHSQITNMNGLILEFGVYNGTSINMMSSIFKNQSVYGFDSFVGFPDDGRTDWQHDFSREGKMPKVNSNVKLVKGWFNESLPKFLSEHNEPVAFIHIDCDLYSSTMYFSELFT